MYVSSGSKDLWIYSKRQDATIIGAFDDVSVAYTPVSDKRVKQNFADLHFDWNGFMNLKPLTYQFIADPSGAQHIGMIAQEVNEIYPEIIKYQQEQDLYHMDYAGIGMIAIKAIQELKSEIDAKDQKILELEARLERLEKRME